MAAGHAYEPRHVSGTGPARLVVGTNTGPGGTNNPVRVSGIEVWQMGQSGLIACSQGIYDTDVVRRPTHRAVDFHVNDHTPVVRMIGA